MFKLLMAIMAGAAASILYCPATWADGDANATADLQKIFNACQKAASSAKICCSSNPKGCPYTQSSGQKTIDKLKYQVQNSTQDYLDQLSAENAQKAGDALNQSVQQATQIIVSTCATAKIDKCHELCGTPLQDFESNNPTYDEQLLLDTKREFNGCRNAVVYNPTPPKRDDPGKVGQNEGDDGNAPKDPGAPPETTTPPPVPPAPAQIGTQPPAPPQPPTDTNPPQTADKNPKPDPSSVKNADRGADGMSDAQLMARMARNPLFPGMGLGEGSNPTTQGTGSAQPQSVIVYQSAPDLSSVAKRYDGKSREGLSRDTASAHFEEAGGAGGRNSEVATRAVQERAMRQMANGQNFSRGPGFGSSPGTSGGFGFDNSTPDLGDRPNAPLPPDRKPNMNMATSGGGSSGGASGRSRSPLAAYLPTGAQYADGSGIAGASTERMQVQPRSVDIWGQVSQRYLYRCKIGLLYDCHSH